MEINWLDKIIIFLFPRWGGRRITERRKFEKFSEPHVLPQPQRFTGDWLKLSRHKDTEDKKHGLHNIAKLETRASFEHALGISDKEKNKWIR